MDYERRTRGSVFAVSAASGASVQPDVPFSDGLSQGLSVHVSSQLSRRTTVQASGDLSYAPMNLAGQLSGPAQLGASSVAALMFDTGQGHQRRAASTVSVTRTLGRRSSAVLAYTYSTAVLSEGSAASTQLASVRFSRQISPFAALRAGYGTGYGHAGSAAEDTAAEGGESGRRQDVDLGVHYERPLPFAGRTTVALNTGSSVFSDGSSQRIRLMAEGSLAHAMSARWAARLDYSRPVQFLAGLAEPLFSDAVAASITGRTTRYTELTVSAGYSRGAVGLHTAGQEFSSRSLTAQFRARLARSWWLEVHAFTGAYSFASADSLSDALPAEFARHGVRGGVSWSAPLRP